MLLLRQLPAAPMSMPVPPISFDSDRLPSCTSVFLSLLATLVLVSFVRAALLCLRGNVDSKLLQQSQVQVVEKAVERSDDAKQRPGSWKWSLSSWKAVSVPSLSLPLSLAPIDKDSVRRGVGMQGKSETRRHEHWPAPRVRKGGPTFETPLPALYQSEPLSMAKLIMSRHTYRKPTGRPPSRLVVPSQKATPSPQPSPSQSNIPISPRIPPSTPPSMV